MAFINVGLALWHKEILSEVDSIASSLRNDTYHPFAYPSQLSAAELQLGGPTIFSRKIGRQYDPFFFSTFAREDRIAQYTEDFHNGRRPDVGRSLEHAVDVVLREIRNRGFVSFHSSDGVFDREQNKVVPCDLSDPDPRGHRLSITQYRNMMTLAGVLDSDVFVMHPGAYRQWLGDLSNRRHRMSVFYDSFRELMQTDAVQGTDFKIALENLEYDKFPATTDELAHLWWNCSNIAEQEGIDRNRIAMCLDLQHLRHSLKIINEPNNYPSLSHTKGIDKLLRGFPNVHRKLFGTSYNWCWKSLRYDSFDIGTNFFSEHISHLKVIHMAGNDDNISETHGPINYRPKGTPTPYYALNQRAAMHALMSHGFDGGVIVEDHSGDLFSHINSAETLRRYIGERL